MKIGTTLYLQRGEDHFRSRLVEKTEGDLLIDLPVDMNTNRTSFIQDGDQLRVSFIHDDSGMYAFDTTVKGRKLGRIPMLVLDYPEKENLSRMQRREFVRIEGSVDVAVHPKEERFHPFTTTTVDLSGGGTAIRLPDDHGLKNNMLISCWIVLPLRSGTIDYLRVTCRVIRIFQSDKETNKWASLAFVEVTERERQQVIRYCFEQQQDRRRKGLVL